MDNVRIDKWLWAARFFKTRSLAADAVDNGKVRLDGERIKPGKTAKLTVTFKKAGKYPYLCTVLGHASAGMEGTFTVR